jgi:O-antigen/teichoic acid export membrane protein
VAEIIDSPPWEPLNAAPPRSVRSNFTWTLVGNVVYAGCQWGILAVLAKLGNPEMVGQFGLALAIAGPVFLFANLNLGAVEATDARGEYSFSEYFGVRIITSALALAAACLIAVLSQRSVVAIAVIFAVSASKAVESLSDIFYGLFQRHEAMDRVAKSMLIRGPLSLLGVAVAVWAYQNVMAAAIALAMVWAAVFVGFDLPRGSAILGNRRLIRPRFDVGSFVRLFRVSAPLGLAMMLISLIANIPRYFLEHERGARDLGIFVGLAYVVTAGTTVVSALGQSALPRMANFYSAGDLHGFKRLVRKLLLVGGALGAGGFLVALVGGPTLLRLLYTSDYAAHSDTFVIIMISAALNYVSSFLGYATTAARFFKQQFPLSFVVTCTTVVLSAFFVPRMGIDGAAWVLVAGGVVNLAGFLWMYAVATSRARMARSTGA